jgi:small nuclear ribonucleoprotein (snRNP)-like protein
MLFACSGIPVQCLGNVTRFVTSASLVKAFNDQKIYHYDLKVDMALIIIYFLFLHKENCDHCLLFPSISLKVLVRHGGNVVIGFLDKCDPYLNVVAVNVMDLHDLHTVVFSRGVKFLPRDTE